MPVGASGGQIVEIASGSPTVVVGSAAGSSVVTRRAVGIALGPTQAGVSGLATAGQAIFTAIAASWTTNDLTVDTFLELALDVTATTTTTSWKYAVNRKGADGAYYAVATSATHTDSGQTNSCSIGSGTAQGSTGVGIADAATGTTKWSAPFAFGDIIQIVFTPVGAFTGTLSLKGK
jgi:hypothetical protein